MKLFKTDHTKYTGEEFLDMCRQGILKVREPNPRKPLQLIYEGGDGRKRKADFSAVPEKMGEMATLLVDLYMGLGIRVPDSLLRLVDKNDK